MLRAFERRLFRFFMALRSGDSQGCNIYPPPTPSADGYPSGARVNLTLARVRFFCSVELVGGGATDPPPLHVRPQLTDPSRSAPDGLRASQ